MKHKSYIIPIVVAVLTFTDSVVMAGTVVTANAVGYVKVSMYDVEPLSFDSGSESCLLSDLVLTTGDDLVQSNIGLDEHNVVSATLEGLYHYGSESGAFMFTGSLELLARDKATKTKGTFDTEIVSMSLSGSAGSSAMSLRESPAAASQGIATIVDIGGGLYHIDSFFDVFTELSVDGGNSWIVQNPAPVRMDLFPEPGTLTLLALGGLALFRRH